MSNLTTLDPMLPIGSDTASIRISETRQKLLASFGVEHALDGKHKMPKVSTLPANDTNSQRLVIKSTTGVADELWYDDGTTWTKITSNQAIIDYVNSLTSHKTVEPIDHPDSSITYMKIALGAIRKKHLDSTTETTSIAALVNTANADALHKHSTSGIENNAITVSKLAIPTIASNGTQTIAMGGNWIPGAGIYNMSYGLANAGTVICELLSGGVWYQTIITSGWFDGTNMRLRETGTGTGKIYWQKF